MFLTNKGIQHMRKTQ